MPAGPASHGCLRVPNWEADWLASRLEVGMGVTVTRLGPAAPPDLPRLTDDEILDLFGIRVPTVDGSHLQAGAHSIV